MSVLGEERNMKSKEILGVWVLSMRWKPVGGGAHKIPEYKQEQCESLGAFSRIPLSLASRGPFPADTR